MKCLYIGSYHCNLERMQIEILNDLGITVFCTGKFMKPSEPRMNAMAAPLNLPFNQALIAEFTKLNPRQTIWGSPKLTHEFVNKFDFVLVDHCGPNQVYFRNVWPMIRHKPVIFRSYGLQLDSQELFLQQCKQQSPFLYTLRFSEKEKCIRNHAGTDAAIPPFVNEEDYSGWTGQNKVLLTFQNWFQSRRKFEGPAYALYDKISSKYNRKLHGIATPGGTVNPQQQKDLYKTSRVYFALGSKPSPYTINLMEALMCGMPVVTWGKQYGEDPALPMYEWTDIITNGINGLCSDNEEEIRAFIQRCFDDYDYAKSIGDAGRKLALEKFSKAAVKPLWQKFLKDKNII